VEEIPTLEAQLLIKKITTFLMEVEKNLLKLLILHERWLAAGTLFANSSTPAHFRLIEIRFKV
jgi:hypothetical protein